MPFAIAAVIAATPPSVEAQSQQRYVSASALNVRAAPELSAQVMGALGINTEVTLLRTLAVSECRSASIADCGPQGGWCLVETRGREKDLRGYVACEYLGATRTSMDALESQLAHLRGGDGERLRALGAADRAKAFDIVERMIALAPSMTSLQRYADLLDALLPGWNDPATPGSAPDAERARRVAAYRAMQRNLVRDVTRELSAQSLKPGTTFYSARRPDGAPIPGRGAARTKSASLFGRDSEVVAWAGGFTVGRERGDRNLAEGAKYFLGIDGYSNIRPLFHVARAMGVTPSVQTYKVADSSPGGIGPDGRPVAATSLEATLKAHAITPSGLRDATVLRVSDQGGACNDVPSGVEFRLRRPEDPILAVFVTSNGFDASRSKVTRSERRYRAAPYTLTRAVLYEVDLDGDGIPDLRGGMTTDQEIDPSSPTPKGYGDRVSLLDLQRERLAFEPPYRGHLRRTAGWYANDITWIEANIGGAWKILSVYNVVTCT